MGGSLTSTPDVTVLTHGVAGFAVSGDIRKTGVVKSAGPAAPVDVRPPEAPSAGEGGTREAVARLLMEQGPITAAAVAAELELSAPAVRRHLDALLADGEAEVRSAPRRGPRGRGRPARQYLLTDAGRARFGHGYDELAVAALQYLAEHGGEAAVRGFARSRVDDLLGAGVQQITAASGPDGRAEALASLLTARGYAAQARESHAGVQLCQHHCPVAHVAAAFPELCEAETQAFAALLGTHVQRLATIARGDSACTTHVPLDAPDVRRKHDTTTTSAGRQPE
ncbi:putative ArsR family transcriptional regulator [Pseudonocardia kunmingensis]|uniref:Putative ArsR family transcriptional regulator n=1 Tax=Pseudonocardia kunmingensis TaxID=630975 RepID=A0A543D3T6_9PSEU|nr:HTH domain-containing protein [Pseudonocardia kunmingensis]TQM04004.1 putative ArsR family transcriptional regulator [Pseudonocardia kunmingensis]